MSEESVALTTIPPAPPPSERDYEAILAAVEETARGRWFLGEYARRNRNADTRVVLDAIDRIEAVLRGDDVGQPFDRLRFDLIEMAKAIARTRAEIAAIKPDAEHDGKIGAASEELDSIVRATESATSDVLAAAEQIQETAWTMREADIDAALCDRLDARATDIYTACSFQDLTGQRIHKVIDVLRYLEQRINAMIAIWGDADGASAVVEAMPGVVAAPDAATLDQADVDMMLHRERAAGPAIEAAIEEADGEPGDTARAAAPEIGETARTDVTEADAPGDSADPPDGGAVRFIQVAPDGDLAEPGFVFLYRDSPDGPAVEAPAPSEDAAASDAPETPSPASAGGALETLAVAAFRAELSEPAPEAPPDATRAVDPLDDIRALSATEKLALCR